MLHILVAFALTNDTPKLVVVEKLYKLSEHIFLFVHMQQC